MNLYNNGFHSYMSYGIVFMILGLAIMLAFLIGIILFIIWIVKKIDYKSITNTPAVNILKTRYAKGEISKEEFEEKIDRLTNNKS